MEAFRTVGQLAKEAGCPIWKVHYLLTSRGIAPIGRAGALRLYAPSVVEKLRKEITAIERRKAVVPCVS